jgi:hypothetical protein
VLAITGPRVIGQAHMTCRDSRDPVIKRAAPALPGHHPEEQMAARDGGAPGQRDSHPIEVSRDPLMPQDVTRIMLRPMASSLPLGFLAFGTGTILLTALELQWVQPVQDHQLMILVLAFVAPLEILAGVFAFLARDAGAATGLTMLGAAWTGTAIVVLTAPPGMLSAPLGISC